jgi:F420-non-reducing hydrogenase iron-sulfur subunit
VWLRWISAAEGRKFADTMSDAVAEFKAKGPNPLKENWSI